MSNHMHLTMYELENCPVCTPSPAPEWKWRFGEGPSGRAAPSSDSLIRLNDALDCACHWPQRDGTPEKIAERLRALPSVMPGDAFKQACKMLFYYVDPFTVRKKDLQMVEQMMKFGQDEDALEVEISKG